MQILENKGFLLTVSISIFISCQVEDPLEGSNGLTSLIQTSSEPAGSNCTLGGLKIQTGLDSNTNGTLDSDEVTKTDYVCSFAGNNGLLNIEDEPAGATCINGGIKIEVGRDDDGDGILDEEEIDVTRYICNGTSGGFDQQIRIKIETPLDNNSNNDFISGSTTYEYAGTGIIAFNKNNYVGVDSVILAANPSNYNDGIRSYVDLFDATNNVAIANSELSRVSTYPDDTYIYSGNLFASLPDQTVDLGIRVKAQEAGLSATAGRPYLILFRRN